MDGWIETSKSEKGINLQIFPWKTELESDNGGMVIRLMREIEAEDVFVESLVNK